MKTQNITHDGTAAGLAVRDIRSAPSLAARGPRVHAEGAASTSASGGWDKAFFVRRETASGESEGRTRSLAERMMDRKLVQWTLAYLGGAWLLLQLSGELCETWNWTMHFRQVVSILLGLGVMPALVVAWYHGEKGSQKVCTTECALVAVSIMASVIVVWSFGLGMGR